MGSTLEGFNTGKKVFPAYPKGVKKQGVKKYRLDVYSGIEMTTVYLGDMKIWNKLKLEIFKLPEYIEQIDGWKYTLDDITKVCLSSKVSTYGGYRYQQIKILYEKKEEHDTP